MKSIIQSTKECFLCRRLVGEGIELPSVGLEDHHCIYGIANRRHSERFGLKVWLCPYHHRHSDTASVHRNVNVDMYLRRTAQEAFEKKHTRAEWMDVFKKNYLED